ncbi:MAG: hypothetical protein PHF60_03745, partial [Candidatus ainarchaeum sp.]|nr:hypothetical protein [Candidatus ainarchaeum sp.]
YYQKMLANGGEALGDFEWVTLLAAFHEHGIPFSTRYVDTDDRYLLGDGIAALAAKDRALGWDIGRWKNVRDDALKHQRGTSTEERLMTHVTTELSLRERLDSLAHDDSLLTAKSVGYGALASMAMSALLGGLLLIARSFSWFVERVRPRRKEEKPVEKVPEKPEEPKNERKDITPTKLEALAGTVKRSICASGTGSRVVDHLPDARKRMEEDFGSDFTDAVFKVLNGKLSNTLAKKIAHGNYEELRKLVLSSRKAFEMAGHDPGKLGGFFAAHQSMVPETNTECQPAYSRKRHPLDDIKRWGWKPGDFHRLLAQYGFDTSEVGGGGHCFVKYEGEKLRYSKGRFVIMPHRTSGTEIKPGAADKVLKACADFLVSKPRITVPTDDS